MFRRLLAWLSRPVPPGVSWFISDYSGGYEWDCNWCASGTGQAPTWSRANRDAHIHFQASHTEVTS